MNKKGVAALSIMTLVFGIPAMFVLWVVFYLFVGALWATIFVLGGMALTALVVWLIATQNSD